MKFMNAKTRRIAILVRVLHINYLEEIFGSQATLAMLRPLRHHRIRLTRMKKPVGKDRQRPNNCNTKYGIRVPSNTKESA